MKFEKILGVADSDPVLDLKKEDEQNVRDAVSEVRSGYANILSDERAKRDEATRLAVQNRKDSKKLVNRAAAFFRGKDHQNHPEQLKLEAQKHELEARQHSEQAKVLHRHISGQARGEYNKEAAKAIRHSVLNPILEFDRTLSIADHGIENEEHYYEKSRDFLDNIPVENVVASLVTELDSGDEFSIKNRVFKALIDAQHTVVNKAERQVFLPNQIEESFGEFVLSIVVTILESKPDIIERFPEQILNLLQSVPTSLGEEKSALIVGAVDSMSESVREKAFENLSHNDNGVKVINKLIYMGADSPSKFISGCVDRYIDYLEDGQKQYDSSLTSSMYRLCNFIGINSIYRLMLDKVGLYVNNKFNVSKGRYIVKSWTGKQYLDLVLNLNPMLQLEKSLPGAVRLLHTEYGICEFKRYPLEMLVEQAKVHGQDVPYGIALYPREDHNDAFDQEFQVVLPKLFDQTRDKFVTRIFEIHSRYDLGRALLRLKRNFPLNKISYAILAGHGAEDLIEFGGYEPGRSDSGGYIDTTHVRKSRSLRGTIKEMFVEEPSIAFFSCSTGKEGGIAQNLSEVLNAHVEAPDIPTSVSDIEVSYLEGKPILHVSYSKGEGARNMVYKEGKKIG